MATGKKAAGGTEAAQPRARNRAGDVDMEVSVEIGRTRLNVEALLNMTEGSLIEIPKVSGEPVDVRANGELFARGEVVVVREHFAVWLTRLVESET